MTPIDVNKAQLQMYGNQVIPEKMPLDKTLFRTLLDEMAKSGRNEDAIRMIADMLEEMDKRIKELESK